jgi:hypothetical protein
MAELERTKAIRKAKKPKCSYFQMYSKANTRIQGRRVNPTIT